jgi:hypothetical protein
MARAQSGRIGRSIDPPRRAGRRRKFLLRASIQRHPNLADDRRRLESAGLSAGYGVVLARSFDSIVRCHSGL